MLLLIHDNPKYSRFLKINTVMIKPPIWYNNNWFRLLNDEYLICVDFGVDEILIVEVVCFFANLNIIHRVILERDHLLISFTC